MHCVIRLRRRGRHCHQGEYRRWQIKSFCWKSCPIDTPTTTSTHKKNIQFATKIWKKHKIFWTSCQLLTAGLPPSHVWGEEGCCGEVGEARPYSNFASIIWPCEKTQTKDVVQHFNFMLCNLTCLRREVAQHCNNIPTQPPHQDHIVLSLYGLRREVQQNYISAVSFAPSSIYTICL